MVTLKDGSSYSMVTLGILIFGSVSNMHDDEVIFLQAAMCSTINKSQAYSDAAKVLEYKVAGSIIDAVAKARQSIVDCGNQHEDIKLFMSMIAHLNNLVESRAVGVRRQHEVS
jgi:hypothetical protein